MLRSAAALAIVAGVVYAADSPPTRITLENGVVRVRPAAAEALLEVFVDGPAGVPPMLGEVVREGDSLRFAPRFPLQPGLGYRAVYRAPGQTPLAVVLELEGAAAGSVAPPTSIERIDPSPDLLPENLLKLYLHFSAPMSRGEAYRRIRLLDEQGRAVELPFLEIDQELWDPDGTRLTLLFDPGRVKRDLLPNKEVGPPLQAGRGYTLVMDRAWPDARGLPLASDGRKSFRVGPPDHTPPRTSDWRVAPPRAGTREPLVVRFPEPLDRALLERVVEIWDGSGAPVLGEIAIDAGETRLSLTPREPWKRGEYTLRAATILEDLAGNSLGRAFEVDVFERVEDRFLEVTANLPFQIE
jgi:hypothetical protein